MIINPNIPMEDVWSPGTVTREKAMAYKRLDTQGLIELVKVRISKKPALRSFNIVLRFQKTEQ